MNSSTNTRRWKDRRLLVRDLVSKLPPVAQDVLLRSVAARLPVEAMLNDLFEQMTLRKPSAIPASAKAQESAKELAGITDPDIYIRGGVVVPNDDTVLGIEIPQAQALAEKARRAERELPGALGDLELAAEELEAFEQERVRGQDLQELRRRQMLWAFRGVLLLVLECITAGGMFLSQGVFGGSRTEQILLSLASGSALSFCSAAIAALLLSNVQDDKVPRWVRWLALPSLILLGLCSGVVRVASVTPSQGLTPILVTCASLGIAVLVTLLVFYLAVETGLASVRVKALGKAYRALKERLAREEAEGERLRARLAEAQTEVDELNQQIAALPALRTAKRQEWRQAEDAGLQAWSRWNKETRAILVATANVYPSAMELSEREFNWVAGELRR